MDDEILERLIDLEAKCVLHTFLITVLLDGQLRSAAEQSPLGRSRAAQIRLNSLRELCNKTLVIDSEEPVAKRLQERVLQQSKGLFDTVERIILESSFDE